MNIIPFRRNKETAETDNIDQSEDIGNGYINREISPASPPAPGTESSRWTSVPPGSADALSQAFAALASKERSFRRSSPRRPFEGRVGLLYSGEYTVFKALQLGEGGVLLSSVTADLPFQPGAQVLLTLILPGGMVMGRARFLYRSPLEGQGQQQQQGQQQVVVAGDPEVGGAGGDDQMKNKSTHAGAKIGENEKVNLSLGFQFLDLPAKERRLIRSHLVA